MNHIHLPAETESFWIQTGKAATYPKLNQDTSVHTAVIGGGIAGIMTAYTLAKAGEKVALLEGRTLLNGTTGNTTAKLTAQHQLIYDELINRYGQDHAQLFYQANMEGIGYIKQVADEHQLSCQMREQDAYVYTQDASQKERFEKEADAYKKLGIPGQVRSDLPLNIDIETAIQMDKQAEFQPVSFLHGVLEVVKDLGNPIYEQTLVEDVDQDQDGTIHLKTHDGYTVTCEHAVFATHYPTFEPDKFFTQMNPEISYALAYKIDKKPFEGMYINTDTPKKTIRTMRADEDHYVLVGGQSHPIGDEKSEISRYQEIDRFAKETFAVDDAAFRWSSHDLITKDRIPFIGQCHPDYPNIYTATGFSKWGLASAATGARVLTDIVRGKKNRYTAMFHPRRDIPDITETVPEPAQTDDQTEQLNLPDKAELLHNKEATIIETENKKTGVYKDENGALHYLNLSCTHLGCGLNWNSGDKTWDCSCHGSRFNAYGEVIEGPALRNLERR